MVGQVGADEQQAVGTEQVAVVGCEKDVGVVQPALFLQELEGAADGLVDQLVLDGDLGPDLTHVVGF